MRKLWWLLGGVVGAVVLGGLLAVVWYGRPAVTSYDGRVTIGTTIFPLADIARQIVGDQVRVVLLIPPGASEHSYSLTPQQLRDLQTAKVLFRIGRGLEDRLTDRLAQTLPDVRLVTVDNGITLRAFDKSLGEEDEDEPHDGGEDPHYWLAVPNAQRIAVTIAENLQQLDPAHAAEYQANLKRYQAELDGLEKELQALSRSTSKKEFIAMHNAWSYLAAQYGFQLVATYELVEGQEPSLTDIKHLQALVGQYGLETFYAEPQKASTAVTSFMQREFGLTVRTLDPVGGVAGRDTYADLMRFNIQALSSGSR